MNNYNDNGIIKYAGFVRTKEEWADIIGITVRALNWRIQHWGLRKAIATPGKKDKCKFIFSGSHKSICWKCKHCVPDPKNNIGCSWSRMERNVPGSIAEVKHISYAEGDILAHVIVSCPEYEKANNDKRGLWRYLINEYSGKDNRKS